MKTDEIIRLIFSFLGGGLVAGIINWVQSALSERKARKTDYIRMQLKDLYSPLQFFTSQNAQLFILNKNFDNAYTSEYIDKKWSNNPGTQKRINRVESETLKLSNQYVDQIKNNNEHIVAVLGDNYFLIDPDDIEIFTRFLVDYTRTNTEIDDTGTLKTPFEVYQKLGNISSIRTEFINAVDKRFKEKQAELEGLLN